MYEIAVVGLVLACVSLRFAWTVRWERMDASDERQVIRAVLFGLAGLACAMFFIHLATNR